MMLDISTVDFARSGGTVTVVTQDARTGAINATTDFGNVNLAEVAGNMYIEQQPAGPDDLRRIEIVPERVVSHDFHMGEWKPDSTVQVRRGFAQTSVYLWIVPAQVAGRWRVTTGTPGGELAFQLELRQKYQALDGVVVGTALVMWLMPNSSRRLKPSVIR